MEKPDITILIMLTICDKCSVAKTEGKAVKSKHEEEGFSNRQSIKHSTAKATRSHGNCWSNRTSPSQQSSSKMPRSSLSSAPRSVRPRPTRFQRSLVAQH